MTTTCKSERIDEYPVDCTGEFDRHFLAINSPVGGVIIAAQWVGGKLRVEVTNSAPDTVELNVRQQGCIVYKHEVEA